jgi:hypothetical protein
MNSPNRVLQSATTEESASLPNKSIDTAHELLLDLVKVQEMITAIIAEKPLSHGTCEKQVLLPAVR